MIRPPGLKPRGSIMIRSRAVWVHPGLKPRGSIMVRSRAAWVRPEVEPRVFRPGA